MSYTHLVIGSSPIAPTSVSDLSASTISSLPRFVIIEYSMRKFLLLFIVVFLVALKLFVVSPVFSDELDDINKKLSELQSALSSSQKATAPLESQLKSLQTQLAGIEARVAAVERDLSEKKKFIDEGYRDLAKNKDIFNKSVRDYYIKSFLLSPLLVFISSGDAADITRAIIYQKKSADRGRDNITSLALKIVDLEKRRKTLEEEEGKLADIKIKLDSEKGAIAKVVKGAKDYQSDLSGQIAQLSAKQQEILGQRLSGLNIPRSAATTTPACVDDRDKDPGFSPRFAFFTYGVPNRTGLNQYGAKGRAATQGHEDILRAYYENIGFETKSNINIKVQGYGEMPLETYLLGIYEMPESWPIEALKAQVIAARSYALAYTNNGTGEICTTQSCQVYKQPHKSGQWVTAVAETSGKVMVQGGQVIKAWYSSTHGGYVFPTSELPGWSATSWTKKAVDTTTGSAGSFNDLHSNAYDKESPWFYCDWGSRASYNKTAWLKPDEVADIINIILLARADSSTKEKLYQTDKPHPYGGEVWNQDRVKSELRSRNITPYNSISDVSVSADFGSGRVNSVNISGDVGSQSFDGSEFKNWFNLRAPANIQIVGPLFNIEKQ